MMPRSRDVSGLHVSGFDREDDLLGLAIEVKNEAAVCRSRPFSFFGALKWNQKMKLLHLKSFVAGIAVSRSLDHSKIRRVNRESFMSRLAFDVDSSVPNESAIARKSKAVNSLAGGRIKPVLC